MTPKFNEDSRVKIPTLIHLTRLGYQYLSLKNAQYDEQTNIFTELFISAIKNINPDLEDRDAQNALKELQLTLDNDDLGKAFYEKLIYSSGIKIIDFINFNNNTFHVVTELTYKNGDDEFRPDITLLINGLPLVFIEVKKPNNPNGILAERERINARFKNKKFKRFINLTQFMIFSNNMEYIDGALEPIEGAFYATTSYQKPSFNYFREETNYDLFNLLLETESIENEILKDNHLISIKGSSEFILNKNSLTPTNRICTSLLQKQRLAFILQYGLAYVDEHDGIQKHIMRYPQIFATKAIEQKFNDGIKQGIIWHTQGSGKTALAFYNVRFLTDYFQKKNIIAKFYFIVDRIDLLIQAQREFKSRGLFVHTISSKEEFAKAIKSNEAIHNNFGSLEITVVNIQKFKNDPTIQNKQSYDLNIQRIYFLDEVHRSYKPDGSYWSNLIESDRNAIKIGLTGTPLLGEEYSSKSLFGDYIHKYYYDSSVADGYTLRLIREEINTTYKMQMQECLKDIKVLKGDFKKNEIFSHKRYVEPLLDYMIKDFQKSRIALNDNSIGAMVICDSSEQAERLFTIFQQKYANQPVEFDYQIQTAELILHDVGDKDFRKEWIEQFKAGKIDILFVYNMLLTGFDAKRLKKLYLSRVIKDHNLLQALTRVNRPYKNFKYGYIVDFADISEEFDKTNQAYFKELQSELGDELKNYSTLFKSEAEIKNEINHIKDVLFHYNLENAEIFSQQISAIQDQSIIRELKKTLANSKSLYNLIRSQNNHEFLHALDFNLLAQLYTETSNRLNLLNLKANLENQHEHTTLLNLAIEDIVFEFIKVDEKELILVEKLQNTIRQTRQALNNNIDPQDPEFIHLKDEFERIFKKKNLQTWSIDDINQNDASLNQVHDLIRELNRKNNLIFQKYQGDAKFARIHKRLNHYDAIDASERQVFELLINIKDNIDLRVIKNQDILNNTAYFEKAVMSIIINEFKKDQTIKLNPKIAKDINHLITNEYYKEFNNITD